MNFRISEANRARSYDARQNRGSSRNALSGPNPKAILDKFAIVPILACVFALIVSPILSFLNPPSAGAVLNGTDADLNNRFFWPAIAAISVFLAVRHGSRIPRPLPPHIICFLAYLALAGASILWSFNPGASFTRFAQQAMIVTSIVLPAMLAAPTGDMMRGLFLCFASASILNIFFVLGGSALIAAYGAKVVEIGYPGYFGGKNYLGECTAFTLLLAFYEVLCRGWRRALGLIVAVVAAFLLIKSDSKTAFGLALVCPILGWLTLLVRKITRVSPAIILSTIPFCWILLSAISNFSMERLSYILYHDSTLTGRTIIWDFAQREIGQRPLFGWGYRSFWLVPNSPALGAPGWVRMMPNAHNGYYDTMLEMGYAGLALLIVFIIATLHAVGRVADRDPRRAQLLLSLALFFIFYNFLESMWMRGFEFLWVGFVIVAVEIGRYWRPFPLGRAARNSRSQGPGGPGPSPGARRPPLRMGLS
jgi:exopolysaccharide production protein ExoQ